ncbi:hypothetical protein HK104_005131 [Borealophlyctis nickersoniae]|nr:hypothetical protein HK104_005131 [Borealophlyctis nickersoniae]
MEGTPIAVESVFDRLSGWDGSAAQEEERGLDAVLSPTLLDRFRHSHKELSEAGLEVELTVEKFNADAVVKDIWLTMGPSRLITSTLMSGPVLRRYSPLKLTKRLTDDYLLYREATFEYILARSAVPEWESSPPALKTRLEGRKKGQRVAFDMMVDVTLRVVLKTKSGEVVKRKKMKRPLNVRLETDHFKELFDVPMRVADIDYALQSERVASEGRPSPDE